MGGTAKKVLFWVVNAVVLLLIGVSVMFVIYSLSEKRNNGVPELFGYKTAVVETGSMKGERPDSFDAGALMLFKEVDAGTLKRGDVITFWDNISLPGERFHRALNSHRIVDIERDGAGGLLFVTKGDANLLNDTDKRRGSDIMGKYVAHIGGGGRMIEFLRSFWGFFFCLVLPLGMFFLWRLIRLVSAVRRYRVAPAGAPTAGAPTAGAPVAQADSGPPEGTAP